MTPGFQVGDVMESPAGYLYLILDCSKGLVTFDVCMDDEVRRGVTFYDKVNFDGFLPRSRQAFSIEESMITSNYSKSKQP